MCIRDRYTENLWGRHPREISPDWGAQRVKGLSITAILKNIFAKKENGEVETSLIEEFSYPKLGPGQLWELTAKSIEETGRGRIIKGARVVSVITGENAAFVKGVRYEKGDQIFEETGDIVISSMPLKDLVEGMEGVPEEIRHIASGLPYRDYMTVGLLLKKLKLKNLTKEKTVNDIIPDNWVYVHDRRVKMGRIQLYNNWSPYLVKDINTVWTGLEYFCNEGDALWNMEDEKFTEMAIDEMITMGAIESRQDVLDSHVERVKKAYPAYFDTYSEIDRLRDYLNSFGNLYCIGRNGQHRYNNIDHSMCTAFETVDNIISGRSDKSNIWSVNTEQAYHEQ